MTTKELEQGSPNIQSKSKTQSGGRWLGVAVGLAAVAAIAIAVYLAVPRGQPAASTAAQLAAAQADRSYPDGVDRAARRSAQSVLEAGQQGIQGYIAAHSAVQPSNAPDVARRAARDAAAANKSGVTGQSQSVPDAAQQGVSGYIAAHSAGQSQSVPDAAQQGVSGYIAAHSAAQPAETTYERAHDDPSYHAPASADRSFHTPQTSDYQYVPTLGQAVPDAAQQGVAGYIAAHSAAQPAESTYGETAFDVTDHTILHYARLPGDRQASSRQSVPDAATQGIDNYLRAHGAKVSIR